MEPRIWVRAYATTDITKPPSTKIGEWQGERETTLAQVRQDVEAWLTENYGNDWEDVNAGYSDIPRYQNKKRWGQYIPVLLQCDDPHRNYTYRRENYRKQADLIAIHEAVLSGDFALATRLAQEVEAAAEAGKQDVQQKIEAAYTAWEQRDLARIDMERNH